MGKISPEGAISQGKTLGGEFPPCTCEGRTPLPCLNSNNTIENSGQGKKNDQNSLPFLSPYHRKQALALQDNTKRFVAMFGVNKVGFLTLTFKDNVTDHKEAYRRFNSLRTNFLSKVFPEYMLVKERQRRGAWHFHLLVGVHSDIRTGFDFSKVFPSKESGLKASYRTASPYLKSLWRELRMAMDLYGFGRSELAPIKSNDEGIAKYVGKYIEQNVVGKNESGYQDKGVRLISYSRNWPRSSTKFSWNTAGGKEWRRKVAKFAEYNGIKSYEGLTEKFGCKWAHFYSDIIQEIDSFDRVQLMKLVRIRLADMDGLYDKKTGRYIRKVDEYVGSIKEHEEKALDCFLNGPSEPSDHLLYIQYLELFKNGSSPDLL